MRCILAAFFSVLLSALGGAQSVSLVNPSSVKRCIEGRWGESAPGSASPLNPGLFWDVTFSDLNSNFVISVTRQDQAIKGAFRYVAGSDGQFQGYLLFNPGPQQTVISNVILAQTDDCRTMNLSGQSWWLRRLPEDPVGATKRPPPSLPPPPALSGKPDWQKHLDWCAGNSDAGGSVDCVADYMGTYPRCVLSGGRSCLIGIARQSAHDNDCQNAFNLAQMCQCNNADAAQQIREAGMVNVCNYLGPPARPMIPLPVPPRPPPPPPSTDAVPSFTVTCVLNVQGVKSAWYDGVSYAFIDNAGHPKEQYMNREVDFSPDPFKNCSGFLGGAVPLGTTRILVKSVSLCTNLISGHHVTLINMLCPKDNP